MLLLNESGRLLPAGAYTLTLKENGRDELRFTLPTRAADYARLLEEKAVRESSDGRRFLLRTVSDDGESADIVCELDLDDWKGEILGAWGSTHSAWSPGEGTAAQLLAPLAARAGWTLTGDLSGTETASPELDGPTPLAAADEVCSLLGVRLRFDNHTKTAAVVDPDLRTEAKRVFLRGKSLLRLRGSGSTEDLVTRLYAEGKDGLTFSSVNGGLPYVEDGTEGRIVSSWYRNTDITDAETLLAMTRAKLKENASPVRSLRVDFGDAERAGAELALFDRVKVGNDRREVCVTGQIAELTVCPVRPEEGSFVLNTVPRSYADRLRALEKAEEDENSALWKAVRSAAKASSTVSGSKNTVLKFGTVSLTPSAGSTSVNVVFDSAYTGLPAVFANVYGSAAGAGTASVYNVTTAGFSVQVTCTAGSTIRVCWFAVGKKN